MSATAATIDLRVPYAPASPDIAHESFDGDVVVVDLENGKYYSFSQSGSVIWLALAGAATPGDLAGEGAFADAIPEFVRRLCEQGLVVARPDIAVALNIPSFNKYEPLVKPGGLLVVNSSLVAAESTRDDITVVRVPANAVAEEYGTAKMMNMAAVGALLAGRPVLPLEVVEAALADHLPASKRHLLDANYKVLRRAAQVVVPA